MINGFPWAHSCLPPKDPKAENRCAVLYNSGTRRVEKCDSRERKWFFSQRITMRIWSYGFLTID
jgi:hypothetical protein